MLRLCLMLNVSGKLFVYAKNSFAKNWKKWEQLNHYHLKKCYHSVFVIVVLIVKNSSGGFILFLLWTQSKSYSFKPHFTEIRSSKKSIYWKLHIRIFLVNYSCLIPIFTHVVLAATAMVSIKCVQTLSEQHEKWAFHKENEWMRI